MSPQPSLSQSATIRRAERLDRLHALVTKTGVVRLNDAARALEVSSMTVRRDLAAEPRALAYLGGYIVSSGHLPAQARYVLDTEVGTNTQQKIEAGRHAARLVEAGDTLFIDCGSTTPHLISHLPNEAGAVTIVSGYSINAAWASGRARMVARTNWSCWVACITRHRIRSVRPRRLPNSNRLASAGFPFSLAVSKAAGREPPRINPARRRSSRAASGQCALVVSRQVMPAVRP